MKPGSLLAEPIQTVMRRHGIDRSYERLKALTRGRSVDRDTLVRFVESLEIPRAEKDALLALRPATYVGAAEGLALEPCTAASTPGAQRSKRTATRRD